VDPDPDPHQNVMDPEQCPISSPLCDRCDQVPGEQSGEGGARAGGRGGRHPVAGPGQALHTEGKASFPFPLAPSLSQLFPPGFIVFSNIKTTLKGRYCRVRSILCWMTNYRIICFLILIVLAK
jgi:hypothetical protein